MTRHITNPVPARRDIDGLAVIGRTRHDLMGIRYDEGENGNTPPAAPPATPPAPPAPTPPAAPAPTPPAPINYRGDPDQYVRELRDEAKTHREAAEAAQRERDEAKAQRDADRAEREAAAAERDTLKRENAIIRHAPKLGGNVDALLDSSSFQKTLATIDPTDTAAVEKAIKDALERNSAYRSGPVLPNASGGGHRGGSNTNTPTTLQGAVSKALGG